MRRNTNGIRAAALALVLLLLLAPAAVSAAGRKPFGPGEKLTFSIRYGLIRAGTAELEVTEDPDGSWIFTSRARTNSFFDVFFKVRDQVRAWVDPATMRSLRFEKRLREGKYSDDEAVVFDHQAGYAIYEEDSTKVPLTPETRDVLSTFFYVRTARLNLNDKIQMIYHSSKKNWPIHVDVGKVEKVKVPAGEFRCIKIEPFLKTVGVFKQAGRLSIWITADERRMPVKLESKVTFGAFEAVLTDYQTP
ncbi:MAG: DUF3108 domain-containing protein [Candidatus Eisenbacteria bacterium]